LQLLLFALLLWILNGCSPVKHLDNDAVLLNKNVVKSDKPALNEGIASIIKQKPNRKILGLFRFHLGVYTLANRGKETRFKKWVKETIGEEPVLLDSVLTRRSLSQVKQFVENSGYFNSTVSDSVVFISKRKANVIYTVHTGIPYTLNKIEYNIPDTAILNIVLSDTAGSLLHVGDIFSNTTFQAERDRLTNVLKNRGYFEFNQQYISYLIDSALGSYQVNVLLVISGTNERVETSDSVVAGIHKVYHIKDVYIQTDYDPLAKVIKIPSDTVVYKEYYFVSSLKKLQYRPEALLHRVFINKNDIYRIDDAEHTYKGLANLAIFKFVNIRYTILEDSLNGNYLNSFVSLTPAPRQDYKVEVEGTHNGGNFGIGGNLVYRNKNSFRGAELIETKFRMRIESIPDFVDTTADRSKPLSLNTYEVGPEFNIRIPRLLWPLKKINKSHTANPYTNFTSSFNYQKRPEYERRLAIFSTGLEFFETKHKKHLIYPAEINFSNFHLTQPFIDKLEAIGDPQLLLYYRNYLITNGRYTFLYNTQEFGKYHDFFFLSFNFEIAGNSLRLLDALNRKNYSKDKTYEILGTPYSQYVRPDADIRYYQVFDSHSSIVYRLSGGIGIAYLNSTFVPYEKTFFSGGANDLRGFRARTVGPGSYNDENNIEQLGDIKINANIEYRFDVFRILEGGIFLDAGNVWLRNQNSSQTGGKFKFNTFPGELAIASGAGVRFDFTFFIFRIDAGVPLKDPSRDPGDRWVFKHLKPRSVIYNFGIGYPF